MTIKLEGNWYKGLAFDVHTLDSSYLGADEFGHDRWKNKRSQMGELVYQLKYQSKIATIERVIDLLSSKIKGLETFDAIIPVPSTKWRPIRPVHEIAKALGKRKRVKVLDLLIKEITHNKQMKNINDPKERKYLLKKHMKLAKSCDMSGMKVLLLGNYSPP